MEKKELQEKLEALYKLLLSLNAFGSLDLKDLNILEAFLKGAFDMKMSDSE